MSISDFEQSLWELALLINPTHLANITTSKLNSYYQDTILDMRKVVLVQNLFNDIYNNWTDHQIRYQQNRRRQIENGEITEQQLLDEESEENESEIEYISDEEGNEIDEDRYETENSTQPDIEMDEDNKENDSNNNNNNNNIIIANSVSHKQNGKPLKKVAENSSITDNKSVEPVIVEPVATKTSKDMTAEKIKSEEMKKKSSKTEIKEQKMVENKENVKKITLDFSGKDSAKIEESKKVSETSEDSDEKEAQKKIDREPRKDSLMANVDLTDEKSNEVIKELQKSGVINHENTPSDEKIQQKNFNKYDSAVSLDEKTESSSVNSISSSNTIGNNNNSIVILEVKNVLPTSTTSTTTTTLKMDKPLPSKQDPKNKVTYRLSDKDVSIKNKYKLDKKKEEKEAKKPMAEQPKVRPRPKKISANDAGMPPAMQRRSMDELLFQFADVMDIVSLIPHIVGDDDLLGNDLTFNSSDLNSKVQTRDSNGNIVEETPRRRPSRAPTPPPTVISNERHQKYIKKKEEMEKSNKRRSSLKFEYHEFEELRKQQELAGYDTTGDVPVTERKPKEISQPRSNSNNNNAANNSYSTAGSCGSAMKMDVLSNCMTSSSSSTSSSNNNHSSSKSSGNKRSSRFFTLTKSKSKSKEKEKEKEKMIKENKENIPSNVSSSNKSYLVRRKSNDKSSNSSVRSHQRYKMGNNSEYSSPTPLYASPTLSSISSSSTDSKASSAKKSYSSATLSKYDLPHISSGERERSSSKQSNSSSNGSPRFLDDIDLSSSSNSSASKHHHPKKATDHKSSSTSEINKFFDDLFRIDWSL
ncbi:hypothetical protein BCR36DRAFT_405921 [Piromyces finnis]|uniref:Uncharacterized protein n=1 Tax=Piromyces finnis TaxID=1754191 RepID=A0A1Y1V3G5_9FUNG|nr:hypothetical protein BCR36DRAFT_405921 [Piromyces finnis]|eukprot:ORX45787.1 hypothetical protein BCR36DRAFT_405921 [Piromyces finnis]